MKFLIVDLLSSVTAPIGANVAAAQFDCEDHSSDCSIWCGGVSCSGWSCSDYKCGPGDADSTFD